MNYQSPFEGCEEAIEQLKKSVREATERFNNIVTVVRCKDCKHILPKGFCHKHSRKVTDDWFCADGERKEAVKLYD